MKTIIIVIIVLINKQRGGEKNSLSIFISYDNRNQIYSLQIIGFDCILCIGTAIQM